MMKQINTVDHIVLTVLFVRASNRVCGASEPLYYLLATAEHVAPPYALPDVTCGVGLEPVAFYSYPMLYC